MEGHKTLNLTQHNEVHVKRERYRQTSLSDRVEVHLMQSHYRPGQSLRVPEGWVSQISWLSAHTYGKFVSPTYRPSLPSRKSPRYSFLLETESTPRSQCGRKDYANSNDIIGKRTPDLPACSTVSQPATLPPVPSLQYQIIMQGHNICRKWRIKDEAVNILECKCTFVQRTVSLRDGQIIRFFFIQMAACHQCYT